MSLNKINNLEECRMYIKEMLLELRPLFAKAAVDDFSLDVPDIKEEDEFAELYTGIQVLVDVIREKTSSLQKEIDERHEVEESLMKRNNELAQAHKAMMNILSDLQQSKNELEK